MTSGDDNAVDITLRAYEEAAQRYADQTPGPGPAYCAFLDRFADTVGRGRVLEIGSGTGKDATYLEGRGLNVSRTDAALAFVEMMRAAGHEARVLDIRTADLGGPWDAVLAQAVLLHLDRAQFADALQRIREAVVDGGVFGFTLKEGDGDAWSEAKLDLPRHFTYWRESALRPVLAQTRWDVISLDHVAGRLEPWLFVLARAA
ncbi:MAG: methyltransferase domain-containing protein [Propionibacteriaceae bacterium]|nr:methyltransferase domain-containing protein [Propionibacteriaceae bacterium]